MPMDRRHEAMMLASDAMQAEVTACRIKAKELEESLTELLITAKNLAQILRDDGEPT